MKRVTWLSLTLLAGATTLAGCASEDYYCDATGCYYCDGIGCREVEPPTHAACRGDFECAGGERCTAAGCVAECEADTECARGAVCRDGLCLGPAEDEPELTPGTCERNADCGDEGLVCRDGLCEEDDRSCGDLGCSCAATGECSEGFLCVAGECRAEEDTCQFDHECGGGGRICVDARCVEACGPETPCATGFDCVDGSCVPEEPTTTCADNGDCEAGQICVDAACIDGCDADEDCAEGYYCEDTLCAVDDRPRPFCADDGDCMPGHPCTGGVCRTPCADHDDCLAFDVQFGYCLEGLCSTTNEVTSDCRTSADCDAGKECRDGICR